MIFNLKRADPLAPEKLFSLDFEASYEQKVFVVESIALKARAKGGRGFTKQQARLWEPISRTAVARIFPEYANLLPYGLRNFAEIPFSIIEPIVHAAGVRDMWGRVPGEPSQYVSSIILPDGSDLIKGLQIYDRGTLSALATRVGVPLTQTPVRFSGGKPRDLVYARWLANWPEATDEELSVSEDELRAALTKRMPAYSRKLFQQLDQLGYHVPLHDRPQFDEDLFN